MKIKTQKQLRAAFWKAFPQFAPLYQASKRQNDYSCDMRMAWCNYVESMRWDNVISEALAQRSTL
jgi:hypothetical protein